MTWLIELFEKIIEYYGQTAAGIVMVVVIIIYGVYLVMKNYSSLIKTYLEQKLHDKDRIHAEAALHRKNITPKIRKELLELAEEVGADRALVFEFSNGNTNLVGLPFLYVSATCEVVTPGTSPVSSQYQKINTSIVAEFLEQLEDKSYYYVSNLKEMKDNSMFVYSLMKQNNVNSALFYSLYSTPSVIGFVVVTTVGNNSFTREKALPRIACSAQLISGYLNFNKMHEEL